MYVYMVVYCVIREWETERERESGGTEGERERKKERERERERDVYLKFLGYRSSLFI